MEIRKRNGESVPFQQEKIFNAMKKAFDGQGMEIGSRELNEILAAVLDNLAAAAPLTVERVQDEVERTLMERGYYEVAKAYILYREKRSALRRVRHTIAQTVGDNSLDEVLRRIQMDFTEEVYSLAALQMKFESFCRPGMTEDERAEALTKAAVELTTAEAPKWEFIAARLLNHSFRCRNAQEWEGRGVGDLYGRLRYLTDKGLYGDYILAHYTHEEIAMAEGFLCPERDELFTYSGLDLLLKRYVIQSRSRVPQETPQEMFLGIALHLAMNEGSDRMGWVKRFYDMNNFWIPEEINLSQDVKDYPRLLSAERSAYDKILSFLVFLDSIQTANLPNIGAYITANEVNLCLSIQAFQECVHSQSYSYMLDTICSPVERNDILYQWKTDEHLLRRNTFIGDCYNEFQERKDAPTLLRVMMANYILEGIYFYSGFMFFYNLSRNGKMPGSAQEIRYINRDENTHLWLFRNIITELQKEQPELFTAESVQALREMMCEGVEQEIAWGHYVIGDDIPGLNRQMISDYIRYLGNLRWTSLGYPALYPGFESEPESMEWVSQYADANMVKTDFFEARSTAYAKSTALIDDL
jgi:ribonucleoside-diphosphate reductase beta chain